MVNQKLSEYYEQKSKPVTIKLEVKSTQKTPAKTSSATRKKSFSTNSADSNYNKKPEPKQTPKRKRSLPNNKVIYSDSYWDLTEMETKDEILPNNHMIY